MFEPISQLFFIIKCFVQDEVTEGCVCHRYAFMNVEGSSSGDLPAHGTFCSVLLTTRCSLHYPTEEDWAQTGLVTVVDVGKCPGPQDGGKCETDLGVPVADV